MSNNTKRHLSLIRELMTTRVVMMEAGALHNYRTQLLHNFNAHIGAESVLDSVLPTERHYMLTLDKQSHRVNSIQFFNENNVLVEENENGDEIVAREPDENEERILMLEMCGPVTRCGGMCSYGSIDFRDIMLEYASDESVVGLVLITDTPGGTAFALHDFAQGMEAWNAAGKRSIQWIDGMSCSAGVALGSQCQRIIAMNGKDIVGCIGAMMAGWMTADGTVDSDGNRFIDVTASQTPDKNGEFRAAAAGDYEALQKEVDSCADDFLSVLAKCRPQVNNEQKTGKTYEAGTVIGSLVDGIGTLDMAIHYALTGEEQWASSLAPVSGDTSLDLENGCGDKPKHEDIDPENPDCDPEDPDCDPNEALIPSSDQSLDNSNTETTMTTIEAQRIAAKMGITPEEVMAIATTEDVAEQPSAAEPAASAAEGAEPAEPSAVPGDQSPVEPAAAPTAAEGAEPANEPAAQEEGESPAPSAAEGAEPASVPGDQSPVDPTEPAEPSAVPGDQSPVEPAEGAEAPSESTADEALILLNERQAEFAAQMAARDAELQQLRDQLAAQQAEAARQERELNQLRNAVPAPAMPAAAPHATHQQVAPSRINDSMTPIEKLKAWNRRGSQIQKERL